MQRQSCAAPRSRAAATIPDHPPPSPLARAMASRGGRGHSEALQHVQRMRDSGHDEASIRRALRYDGPG
eukprot:10427263-Heterocapsa_arctica.AAC.1